MKAVALFPVVVVPMTKDYTGKLDNLASAALGENTD
jgi:hypothetical protein